MTKFIQFISNSRLNHKHKHKKKLTKKDNLKNSILLSCIEIQGWRQYTLLMTASVSL